jgi:hypothetical protein
MIIAASVRPSLPLLKSPEESLLRRLYRMFRPRVALVQQQGEIVAQFRAALHRGLEQRLLDVARMSPQMAMAASPKIGAKVFSSVM